VASTIIYLKVSSNNGTSPIINGSLQVVRIA
jgi:hypothetical protein